MRETARVERGDDEQGEDDLAMRSEKRDWHGAQEVNNSKKAKPAASRRQNSAGIGNVMTRNLARRSLGKPKTRATFEGG